MVMMMVREMIKEEPLLISSKGEWEEHTMQMIKTAILSNYPVGAQEDPGSMAHKKDCH